VGKYEFRKSIDNLWKIQRNIQFYRSIGGLKIICNLLQYSSSDISLVSEEYFGVKES